MNPEKFMNGIDGVRALIVHSPLAFGIEPGVKAGLGLPERKALLESFQSTFSLKARLSPIPEIATKSYARRLPIKAGWQKDIVMEFWMSPKMYERVLSILTTPIERNKWSGIVITYRHPG